MQRVGVLLKRQHVVVRRVAENGIEHFAIADAVKALERIGVGVVENDLVVDENGVAAFWAGQSRQVNQLVDFNEVGGRLV